MTRGVSVTSLHAGNSVSPGYTCPSTGRFLCQPEHVCMSYPSLDTPWMSEHTPHFADYSGNKDAYSHPDEAGEAPASTLLV